MNIQPLFLSILYLMMFMSSCAPTVSTLVSRKDATPKELQSLFDRREKEQQSMKGMVLVNFRPLHGASQAVNGMIAFEKEDRFRFLGFDSFGKTVVDLIISGNFFKIRVGEEPPFVHERSIQSDLKIRLGQTEWRWDNWNVLLKIMEEIQFGGNPVASSNETVYLEKGEDNFICSVLKIEEKQGVLMKKIWVERSLFHPVKEEIYEETAAGDSRLIGTFYFDHFIDKNNRSWPGKIKVKSEEGDIEVDFLEVNFSPLFPPDFFNVE